MKDFTLFCINPDLVNLDLFIERAIMSQEAGQTCQATWDWAILHYLWGKWWDGWVGRRPLMSQFASYPFTDLGFSVILSNSVICHIFLLNVSSKTYYVIGKLRKCWNPLRVEVLRGYSRNSHRWALTSKRATPTYFSAKFSWKLREYEENWIEGGMYPKLLSNFWKTVLLPCL